MMITFRFIGWVLATVLAIISANFDIRIFPHYVIIFLLCIPVFSLIFGIINLLRLDISFLDKDQFVIFNQTHPRAMVIKNNNFLSSVEIDLYDEKDNKYNLIINPKREETFWINQDVFHIGPSKDPKVEIYLYDPFMLFRFNMTKRLKKTEYKLFGIPISESKQETNINKDGLDTQNFNQQKVTDVSNEISNIKELQPGDPMKKIHWKLSARLGEWMVKQFNENKSKSMTLFHDLPVVKEYNDFNHFLRDKILQTEFSLANYGLKDQFEITFPKHLNTSENSLDNVTDIQHWMAKLPLDAHSDLLKQLESSNKSDVVIVLSYQLNKELVNQLIETKDSTTSLFFYYIGQGLDKFQIEMVETLKNHNIMVEVDDEANE